MEREPDAQGAMGKRSLIEGCGASNASKGVGLARFAAGVAGCLALAMASPAQASSTRGLVVSMDPLPGSSQCELVIDDELSSRRLSFVASAHVCAQRAQWVGKRALFHLSLADLGGRLYPMATRVGPWPGEEAPAGR